jgi:hypothetical protein
MSAFNVGEQVVIRCGECRGQKGRVLEKQPAEVYTVLLPGGRVLYYCAASLMAVSTRHRSIVEPAVWNPSRN